MKKSIRLKQKRLKASTILDLKAAKKASNLPYYRAQAKNQKTYSFMESEKIRLSTPKLEKVTDLINFYKNLGSTVTSSTGGALLGLYKKNRDFALLKKSKPLAVQITNSNLLSIIAKPETLMLAYRQIKGNKGALTPGAPISNATYMAMDITQKEQYLRSIKFPDTISLYDFGLVAVLLSKGKYPWGTSSRIYFPKPGQPGKLRPITIPPFMDRIVQKAIDMVLTAIYEPYFEINNRSFGFRPNKGVHDAMAALLSKKTNGMRTAIEGDIEAAYDTVNKQTLINILRKKIKDEQFLKLIEQRLQYEYLEKETGIRVTPELGIPQGGIDSPYLFNIYLMELDEYISNDVQTEIDKLNNRLQRGNLTLKRKVNKNFSSIKAKIKLYLRKVKKIKNKIHSKEGNPENINIDQYKSQLYANIKKVRKANHRKNYISNSHPNSKILRIFYARYADDWILLTNGNKEIASYLKNLIGNFLLNNLGLKLSQSKTQITDITKSAAKFLGFELRISPRGPLVKKAIKLKGKTFSFKKWNRQKESGLLVWAQPDRQRLINKLYMKGYCNKIGFPLELPWLSTLEPHAIIERYNSIIRGTANYFLPAVRNPCRILQWIYIYRYSCLKTLAQKYKTSIRQIYKRFGHNIKNRSKQTIRVKVVQTHKGENYSKHWTLLTYQDLIKTNKNKTYMETLTRTFWDREEGQIGEYPLKVGKIAAVTNENYLDSISWVSWRTMAALDMPCANCGTSEDVHQHHIKAIRKRAYALIPEPEKYQQIMALRNRKQIPLCECCHLKLVHGGKYDGPRLIHMAPTNKLVDNRVIHVESFVKPGNTYYAKTLLEKGYKLEPKS